MKRLKCLEFKIEEKIDKLLNKSNILCGMTAVIISYMVAKLDIDIFNIFIYSTTTNKTKFGLFEIIILLLFAMPIFMGHANLNYKGLIICATINIINYLNIKLGNVEFLPDYLILSPLVYVYLIIDLIILSPFFWIYADDLTSKYSLLSIIIGIVSLPLIYSIDALAPFFIFTIANFYLEKINKNYDIYRGYRFQILLLLIYLIIVKTTVVEIKLIPYLIYLLITPFLGIITIEEQITTKAKLIKEEQERKEKQEKEKQEKEKQEKEKQENIRIEKAEKEANEKLLVEKMTAYFEELSSDYLCDINEFTEDNFAELWDKTYGIFIKEITKEIELYINELSPKNKSVIIEDIILQRSKEIFNRFDDFLDNNNFYCKTRICTEIGNFFMIPEQIEKKVYLYAGKYFEKIVPKENEKVVKILDDLYERFKNSHEGYVKDLTYLIYQGIHTVGESFIADIRQRAENGESAAQYYMINELDPLPFNKKELPFRYRYSILRYDRNYKSQDAFKFAKMLAKKNDGFGLFYLSMTYKTANSFSGFDSEKSNFYKEVAAKEGNIAALIDISESVLKQIEISENDNPDLAYKQYQKFINDSKLYKNDILTNRAKKNIERLELLDKVDASNTENAENISTEDLEFETMLKNNVIGKKVVFIKDIEKIKENRLKVQEYIDINRNTEATLAIRGIVEQITKHYTQTYCPSYALDTIKNQLDALSAIDIIDNHIISGLHKLRMLSNKGVHGNDISSEEIKELIPWMDEIILYYMNNE